MLMHIIMNKTRDILHIKGMGNTIVQIVAINV